MPENVIQANGVELCTEPLGDPAEPPLLLIMGLGASMLWWDDALCHLLADSGLYVIRYDHRDTGRSTTCEPGHPDYDGADLVRDAAAVLDGYGLGAAHVMGVSAGGAIAQLLALDHPERVLSLTVVSSSPVTPPTSDLPAPTERFDEFVATAVVDWPDPTSVTDYLVGYARMLAGDARVFDESACRDLVRRDLQRATSPAAMQNHDLIVHDNQPRSTMSSISARTLVAHGTRDPMFPLAHGQALAEAIPDATFLELEGAGHGIDPQDRAAITSAVIEHIELAQGPIPELDSRFSAPDSRPTPWSDARRVLETAELFWISTVRTTGRPHVTPLPAVWHRNRLHFCTGPTEQKAVNLAGEPRVALTTGNNQWKSGLDVVVEGTARRVTDEATLTALADLWRTKYHGDWDFAVDDGMFRDGAGSAMVFDVAPTTVLAFAKGEFAQTRYRFPNRTGRP